MSHKILIVDDDPHMVHLLSYKLRQMGFEVITANNGREGYDLACQYKPALAVTDFQMPIMNGFEMAVKLNASAETSEIPLIMLTARGHKISPSDLLQTNIKSLISKPFSARQLITNISELLIPHEHASTESSGNHDEDDDGT